MPRTVRLEHRFRFGVEADEALLLEVLYRVAVITAFGRYDVNLAGEYGKIEIFNLFWIYFCWIHSSVVVVSAGISTAGAGSMITVVS